MSFLLAKILLLLVLAALLGAAFARWWYRRHYEDVTSEFTQLSSDDQAWRKSLDERLAQPLNFDASALASRLDAIEAALRGLPQPTVPNLSPVLARLDDVEQRIGAIRFPELPAPVDLGPTERQLADLAPLLEKVAQLEGIRLSATPALDLKPLQQQLSELDRAVKSIQIPAARVVDLQPTEQGLASLRAAIQAIRIPPPVPVDLAPLLARLGEVERTMKTLPTPAPLDLSHVTSRLQTLEEAVRAIRVPATPAPLDLAPTGQRLDALERAVRAIVIPPPTSVDLGPVLQQLAALQNRLAQAPPAPAAGAAPAAVAPAASAPPRPVVRAGSRNLLARAAYGKPDDLKLIKGVAEVLEEMLHKVGVYYFWQIAEWTRSDVAHVDAQLTAFKGRISRDGWVAQSRAFARTPGAAVKPSDF